MKMLRIHVFGVVIRMYNMFIVTIGFIMILYF